MLRPGAAKAIAGISGAVLIILGGIVIAQGEELGAILLLAGVLLALDPLEDHHGNC